MEPFPDHTRQKRTHPWDAYPLGTQALAIMGGAWTRVTGGWKWGALAGSGGVFPTPGGDASGDLLVPPVKVLHLVLKHEWFDKVAAGEKWTEYRFPASQLGKRLLAKPEAYTHVRFARGYTRHRSDTFLIRYIDQGPCPLEGWAGSYVRIHYKPCLLQ